MTTNTLSHTPSRVQRRGLLTGAALVVGGTVASRAVSAPAPDGQLIAFCTSYVKADIRHAEICEMQDSMLQPLTPALDAEWNRLDDLGLEQGLIMFDLEPKIIALPAVSQAGVQAKAEAVARASRLYKDNNGGALLRSLLSDLLPAGRA